MSAKWIATCIDGYFTGAELNFVLLGTNRMVCNKELSELTVVPMVKQSIFHTLHVFKYCCKSNLFLELHHDLLYLWKLQLFVHVTHGLEGRKQLLNC